MVVESAEKVAVAHMNSLPVLRIVGGDSAQVEEILSGRE
jgi:hypothetical protein